MNSACASRKSRIGPQPASIHGLRDRFRDPLTASPYSFVARHSVAPKYTPEAIDTRPASTNIGAYPHSAATRPSRYGASIEPKSNSDVDTTELSPNASAGVCAMIIALIA